MGVQIAPSVVVVKDVAAVFVTATLPPFSRPGMKIDVTFAVGDAKSLFGGVLLLTALRAPNGQVYAVAQGPLVIGGYSEGANGSSKTVNHLTVEELPRWNGRARCGRRFEPLSDCLAFVAKPDFTQRVT